MDWLDIFAVQGTLKSLLQHQSSKASILNSAQTTTGLKPGNMRLFWGATSRTGLSTATRICLRDYLHLERQGQGQGLLFLDSPLQDPILSLEASLCIL